jgi:hypothetical protein
MNQEKIDLAIDFFKKSLEIESVPKTAYLIAKLYK